MQEELFYVTSNLEVGLAMLSQKKKTNLKAQKTQKLRKQNDGNIKKARRYEKRNVERKISFLDRVGYKKVGIELTNKAMLCKSDVPIKKNDKNQLCINIAYKKA